MLTSSHRHGSGSLRIFTWAQTCSWKKVLRGCLDFLKKRQKIMRAEHFLILLEVNEYYALNFSEDEISRREKRLKVGRALKLHNFYCF